MADQATTTKSRHPAQTRDIEARDSTDVERYLHHVAHLDLPLSVKIEMLGALRQIMQSFVGSAFGDDPVQQAGNARDKSAKQAESAESSVVGSRRHESRQNAKRLASAFHEGDRPARDGKNEDQQ